MGNGCALGRALGIGPDYATMMTRARIEKGQLKWKNRASCIAVEARA
jgi:hypothetical protein